MPAAPSGTRSATATITAATWPSTGSDRSRRHERPRELVRVDLQLLQPRCPPRPPGRDPQPPQSPRLHGRVRGQIGLDGMNGRENWCEWIYSSYNRDARRALRDAIRNRHNHRGYMAEYGVRSVSTA